MSSTYIVTQSFKILFSLRAEIQVSNLLFYSKGFGFTNLVSVLLWRAALGTLTLESFALFILGARKWFKSQPLSFSRNKAASQLLRSRANAGSQFQFSTQLFKNCFDFEIIFIKLKSSSSFIEFSCEISFTRKIYNDHQISPL